MFWRCRATVCSLMCRAAPISRLVLPAATSRRTSHSRPVSPDASPGGCPPSAAIRSRSGRAPSRSNVALAASSSSSADSTSPSAGHAAPPRPAPGQRRRASPTRASPPRRGASAVRAPVRIAVGEAHRADGIGGDRSEQRRGRDLGRSGQGRAGLPGTVGVTGREQDVDSRGEHRRVPARRPRCRRACG